MATIAHREIDMVIDCVPQVTIVVILLETIRLHLVPQEHSKKSKGLGVSKLLRLS